MECLSLSINISFWQNVLRGGKIALGCMASQLWSCHATPPHILHSLKTASCQLKTVSSFMSVCLTLPDYLTSGFTQLYRRRAACSLYLFCTSASMTGLLRAMFTQKFCINKHSPEWKKSLWYTVIQIWYLPTPHCIFVLSEEFYIIYRCICMSVGWAL